MDKPWLNDCTSNTPSKIKQTVALKAEIKNEIYKKEMIVDSLNNTIIKLVKSIITPLNEKMLHKAWQQQSEKLKKDRNMYEFVKDTIIGDFFNGNKKAKLKEIVMCGYDEYAYNFKVEFHNVSFQITYPCTSNITKEDHLLATSHGEYILRYEDDSSCWAWITSSYDPSDIAKAIEKLIVDKGAE